MVVCCYLPAFDDLHDTGLVSQDKVLSAKKGQPGSGNAGSERRRCGWKCTASVAEGYRTQASTKSGLMSAAWCGHCKIAVNLAMGALMKSDSFDCAGTGHHSAAAMSRSENASLSPVVSSIERSIYRPRNPLASPEQDEGARSEEIRLTRNMSIPVVQAGLTGTGRLLKQRSKLVLSPRLDTQCPALFWDPSLIVPSRETPDLSLCLGLDACKVPTLLMT